MDENLVVAVDIFPLITGQAGCAAPILPLLLRGISRGSGGAGIVWID